MWSLETGWEMFSREIPPNVLDLNGFKFKCLWLKIVLRVLVNSENLFNKYGAYTICKLLKCYKEYEDACS